METKLSLAPLQGITDYIFRNSFNYYFGNIDTYYCPFIRIEKGDIRKSKIRDFSIENNNKMNFIPQILTNDKEEFIKLASMLSKDYSEVNWNLGCPFPMVAKHNLGSGLLDKPELIDDILKHAFENLDCKISIKLRSGYKSEEDIMNLIPVLNNYNLSELIIHPRLGIQQYKGEANLDIVKKVSEVYKNKITYNGDIINKESFENIQNELPNINSYMLGRGLIANPFLAQEIKGITTDVDKLELFKEFHADLLNRYSNLLNGDTQILKRMQGFWEYFSLSFTNSHKTHKKIKKASNASKYINAINQIFKEEKWIS